MNKVSKSELKDLMDGDEEVLVINVLPRKYFEKRHIPGSVNIPVKDNDSFTKEVSLMATSKDQHVVVYCANTECDLSEKAVRQLEEANFTNISDYQEGTEGWFKDQKHAA
ncbi:MAG: rhodanese-like domain-containing protein [Rickettsiales bacterium]